MSIAWDSAGVVVNGGDMENRILYSFTTSPIVYYASQTRTFSTKGYFYLSHFFQGTKGSKSSRPGFYVDFSRVLK